MTSFVTELQKNASGVIKKTIHQEVSFLSYKLLIGIVITSVVVFSLIQFGFAYLKLLSLYKDELNMQLISFGSLVILGNLGLYFLFKTKKVEIQTEAVSASPVLLQSLVSSFASGIMEGYKSGTPRRDEVNTESEVN